MKKWFRKLQWILSRNWYRVKCKLGWWYCEHCEKMHGPFTTKYDFFEDLQYECDRGVDNIPVPKPYEGDPDFFYKLAKDLHRVV